MSKQWDEEHYEYWSKKAYLKRVKEYQQDIRHAQRVVQHSGSKDDKNVLKSTIQSFRFHKIAYKVLHRGKSLFDKGNTE